MNVHLTPEHLAQWKANAAEDDREGIAFSAHPQAILSLIERVEAAEAEVKRLLCGEPDVLRHEIAALRAKVAAVEALHAMEERVTSGSSDPNLVPLTERVCRHCGGLSYPCATIRALATEATP